MSAAAAGTGRRFASVLIANRGEIAVRIARSARALGLRTIAVASDADRDAPHVRACDDVVAIGGARPGDSYLRVERLVEAARESAAQAVHPGYGFLSESAAFARAVEDAGLVFVGPPAGAIAAMGDKAEARRRAAALGVPVLAGYDDAEQGSEAFRRAADRVGYPVMIKAAAGGGGRGMRRVDGPEALDAALAGARSEARAAFGDDRLLLERALRAPRHVEIQVLADGHGRAVFLGERDCSVQRRHQKIVEEAPCPVLAPAGRRAMGEAALRLVRAIGYVGAGTVEFLLDGDGFYFMEMNTRLQVEHPVTEAVLGFDLVAAQLRIAMGEPLALDQGEVLARFEGGGHAIEVRLCAEDPGRDFLPCSGRIAHWCPPDGVRLDHALESGLGVSPFYDSLLGKAIAHAPSRAEAARRLAAALDRTIVFGLPTNRAFLAALLRHREFLDGDVATDLLARAFADAGARMAAATPLHWALAAFLSVAVGRRGDAAWPPELRRWSSSGERKAMFRLAAAGTTRTGTVAAQGVAARVSWQDAGGERVVRIEAAAPMRPAAWVAATVDGRRVECFFLHADDRLWLQADGIEGEFEDLRLQPAVRASPAAAAGAIAAAMHGRVVGVSVHAGERVAAGATLVTLEAMKMEHRMDAPGAGRVRAVHVRAGEQVAAGRVLMELDLDAVAPRAPVP